MRLPPSSVMSGLGTCQWSHTNKNGVREKGRKTTSRDGEGNPAMDELLAKRTKFRMCNSEACVLMAAVAVATNTRNKQPQIDDAISVATHEHGTHAEVCGDARVGIRALRTPSWNDSRKESSCRSARRVMLRCCAGRTGRTGRAPVLDRRVKVVACWPGMARQWRGNARHVRAQCDEWRASISLCATATVFVVFDEQRDRP